LKRSVPKKVEFETITEITKVEMQWRNNSQPRVCSRLHYIINKGRWA